MLIGDKPSPNSLRFPAIHIYIFKNSVYTFFISSGLADLGTPSVSYNAVVLRSMVQKQKKKGSSKREKSKNKIFCGFKQGQIFIFVTSSGMQVVVVWRSKEHVTCHPLRDFQYVSLFSPVLHCYSISIVLVDVAAVRLASDPWPGHVSRTDKTRLRLAPMFLVTRFCPKVHWYTNSQASVPVFCVCCLYVTLRISSN